jgi:hypothetical protein
MVNTSGNETDTRVDDQPTVLPELGHEMSEDTPRPQLSVPAAWPQPLEPRL